MARITNKSNKVATEQQAPAKVARVAKGAKQAPAKAPKAPKAAKGAKQAPAKGSAQAKARGQYAGKTVSLTEAGKVATPRGSAGELFAAIGKGGKVDSIIGREYTRSTGKYNEETWQVKATDLAYFEKRGLIEIA